MMMFQTIQWITDIKPQTSKSKKVVGLHSDIRLLAIMELARVSGTGMHILARVRTVKHAASNS